MARRIPSNVLQPHLGRLPSWERTCLGMDHSPRRKELLRAASMSPAALIRHHRVGSWVVMLGPATGSKGDPVRSKVLWQALFRLFTDHRRDRSVLAFLASGSSTRLARGEVCIW